MPAGPRIGEDAESDQAAHMQRSVPYGKDDECPRVQPRRKHRRGIAGQSCCNRRAERSEALCERHDGHTDLQQVAPAAFVRRPDPTDVTARRSGRR